ncbi:GntR family transcriptional regulator [Macrococcus capreoli]|uniref:FadR/GntR family transcriptional regulator n=1 Tax=Macrococcus capreoli TaxID=2982690 RepID=UPI0021D59C45|nr:GntR family transcriptional regulator [Macrococcus sp. TMW 2.2395]MCU7558353.1 GntR family transcriptional regulator [Macrococcus sp. TMW 2.2395]
MNPIPNKGFNAVITAINDIIKTKNLTAGDKLPSERYLSDNLNISRSSVREALRALEMLGVIETRRGEGTYITEMDNNQFIEMIAGYVITTETQQTEITDFIHIIEKMAQVDGAAQSDLSQAIESRNTIMFRVWKLLKQFEKTYEIEG